MLDRDLAKLYNIETKVLKQAVRRNIDRFPVDFMFELNKEEYANLRSQFVTSSWGGARIEEIKKKLANQDKNIELVFTYLDELITKQENPKPMRRVGYRRSSEKD